MALGRNPLIDGRAEYISITYLQRVEEKNSARNRDQY